MKMPYYQCRNSHCGDKMILILSYVHNEISYTNNTTSLCWIRALVSWLSHLWCSSHQPLGFTQPELFRTALWYGPRLPPQHGNILHWMGHSDTDSSLPKLLFWKQKMWKLASQDLHHKEWRPQFNTKISSYQHRWSHCGDNMVLMSHFLYNGISYTDNTYRIMYGLLLITMFVVTSGVIRQKLLANHLTSDHKHTY